MKFVFEFDLDHCNGHPASLMSALKGMITSIVHATGIDQSGEPCAANPDEAIRDIREIHYGTHFGGATFSEAERVNQTGWYAVVDEPYRYKEPDAPARANIDPDGNVSIVKPH